MQTKKWLALLGAALPASVFAADVDGAALAPFWGLPFAGMLLSIAFFPLLAPSFWHAHFGKVAAAWSALFLLPFAFWHGVHAGLQVLVHAFLAEYLPFIALLAALYTVAGGICLHGRLRASPGVNVLVLGVGALLASVMGTTGAAMLLIRPLLHANEGRRSAVHVVVFFIFIVANAGGALTPLGDPPLFLGFLQGVGFFWTTRHLVLPTVLTCGLLLGLFYCIDRRHMRRDRDFSERIGRCDAPRLWVEGKANFILLLAVIAAVLVSGVWHPGIEFSVLGTSVQLQDLMREIALFLILAASLRITPPGARAGNEFDWMPIAEVAKLFAGIFITIAPVLAILGAGEAGAFGAVVRLVHDARGEPVDLLYFWATGLLSAFLDNAPTYLVFFKAAGGDAATLMGAGATTLTALSAGAVFMGALTYIGNAPNFMVKAIAEERGIKMPSFFGYMGWSCAILLPLFALVSALFFRQ